MYFFKSTTHSPYQDLVQLVVGRQECLVQLLLGLQAVQETLPFDQAQVVALLVADLLIQLERGPFELPVCSPLREFVQQYRRVLSEIDLNG